MSTFPDLVSPAYCYRLEILAEGREWITANQRLFWRVRSERTKSWRHTTSVRAQEANLPQLKQVWIVCELRFPDIRRRDPANWAPTAKACVDGLVDAGVLVDDSYRYVTGPDMRLGPKVPADWRGLHLLIYPLESK